MFKRAHRQTQLQAVHCSDTYFANTHYNIILPFLPLRDNDQNVYFMLQTASIVYIFFSKITECTVIIGNGCTLKAVKRIQLCFILAPIHLHKTEINAHTFSLKTHMLQKLVHHMMYHIIIYNFYLNNFKYAIYSMKCK